MNKEISDKILEKLADLEHKQWAHWAKYMMTKIHDEDSFRRWERQIKTPYFKLSEEEKESDREWARKAISLTLAECQKQKEDFVKKLSERIFNRYKQEAFFHCDACKDEFFHILDNLAKESEMGGGE